MRILATLMMVTVHCSGPISEHYPNYNTFWWHISNFWDALSRPNVPLFVMLSGYLLFSKSYAIGAFFKKRFSRVVIPALTWMAIYLIFTHWWDGQPATLSQATRMVIEGPVHYHLWFIYLIIGLYACYPFIEPWVRQARERDFLLLFGICFIAVFLYKIGDQLFGLPHGLKLDFFSNHLAYFVGGYYLGHKPLQGAEPTNEKISAWRLSKKTMLWLSLALIALGTAITGFGTYWMGHENAVFHPYFYDYLTLNVAAATVGWFLLIRHFGAKKPLDPLEKDFAAASYGVYLSHVLVLYWLNYDLIFHSRWHPALDIPLTVFFAAFESFVLIWFIQKAPPNISKWFV